MNMAALPLAWYDGSATVTVYPVILWDEKERVLVDCGYPGSLPSLEYQLITLNLSLGAVTKIIVTHHDHDHMGALRELEEKYPHIEIFCSEVQRPYVTGKSKSLRVLQAEEELLSRDMSEEGRKEVSRIKEYLLSIRPAKHAHPLHPGEVLPWCGGLEVVDTQGHMPGHISLYVKATKTLIAGDALVVTLGRLCNSSPESILDMEQSLRSIQGLARYPLERIICYHGGEYTYAIQKSLMQILESVSRQHKRIVRSSTPEE